MGDTFPIDPENMSLLRIQGADGTVLINLMASGRVVIAKGVPVDEAARRFWDEVRRLSKNDALRLLCPRCKAEL